MTNQDHHAAEQAKHCASAEAVGLLVALLRVGKLPPEYRFQAHTIVKRYDEAAAKASALLDADTPGVRMNKLVDEMVAALFYHTLGPSADAVEKAMHMAYQLGHNDGALEACKTALAAVDRVSATRPANESVAS